MPQLQQEQVQAVQAVQTQKGKVALMLAPYYDKVTSLASTVERALIEYLQAEGMSVLTMEGEEATHSNFEKIMKEKGGEGNIDLIVYVGHGTGEAWIGQQPAERMMLTAEESGALSGAVVVSISCNTLKVLGNTAVTKKCRAFLGFDDLVICPLTDMGMADRNYFGDFIRTFMTPINTLIQGRPVNKAVLEFRNICKSYAKRYEAEEFLMWNYHKFAMLSNASSFNYAGGPSVVL